MSVVLASVVLIGCLSKRLPPAGRVGYRTKRRPIGTVSRCGSKEALTNFIRSVLRGDQPLNLEDHLCLSLSGSTRTSRPTQLSRLTAMNTKSRAYRTRSCDRSAPLVGRRDCVVLRRGFWRGGLPYAGRARPVGWLSSRAANRASLRTVHFFVETALSGERLYNRSAWACPAGVWG